MNNSFFSNLKSVLGSTGSLAGGKEELKKRYDEYWRKWNNDEEVTDEDRAYNHLYLNNSDPGGTVSSLVRSWRENYPDDDKGTVFEGVDADDTPSLFDEYLEYKAEDDGLSLDDMSELDKVRFAISTVNSLTKRAKPKSYWDELEKDVSIWNGGDDLRKTRHDLAKDYSTYKAIMHGVDDRIKRGREEKAKKAEEEAKGNYVEFTYNPGDNFGQKIIDLGIATDNGLWGDNGDVNYYTKQLRDNGYLQDGGNVKLGVPIRLKVRE